MKKQRGYTLVEMFIVLAFLGIVAVGGVAIYVIAHFLSKFW